MAEAYWQKYRSNIDQQIEQSGLADGLGDNSYKGQPLADAGKPYREDWWVSDYVRREGVSSETYLPTSLRLRREIERVDRAAAKMRSEREVRALVDGLNEEVAAWRRAPTPPHVSLATVDADVVVARWRLACEDLAGASATDGMVPPATTPSRPERRSRSWRNLLDRLRPGGQPSR